MCPESPTVVGPCSPYAPVLDNVYKSIPFTIPSLVAPSLTCICISCLGDEADCVSSLENIILDGFFVFHVTNAGYISDTDVCFAPNPPPILGLVTLILDGDIPSACEIILLQWNTICVELTT